MTHLDNTQTRRFPWVSKLCHAQTDHTKKERETLISMATGLESKNEDKKQKKTHSP